MSSPSPQSSPPTSQPSNSTSPLLASTPSSLPPPNSTAPPVPTSPASASTQPPYPAAALPHTPTSPPAPETPSSRPAPTKSPLGLPSPPAPTSRSRSSSRPSPGGKSPPVSHSPPSLGSSSSSSDPISTPVIVAIGVSALAVVAVISILCVCGRKRRRRAYAERDYYEGPPLSPPLPHKDNIYGVPQNWQLTAPPPEDPVVRLPEHPNPPPPFPSHSGRVPSARQPPTLPPPPPMISSSGASGSNYSGPEILLPPPSPSFAHGFSKNTFTFEELAMATDGFSEANLVGQGGFGYVHKGILLNGKEVAIKQLKLGSGQGEREFQAEIEIISRVHHKHLVSLVGYCISGGRKLLVYEFVPNKTLECHLHGKDQPLMDCSTRLKIALGSAKGLAYLHEDCNPKIIHRDIKASNILLDYNFEAKVADFGLAKFASDNNTHVSTRVMGTFGYLAPEYASSGKLTDKSDVFSFGVMLLELITGRPPVGTTLSTDESLVDWARPRVTQAIEGDYYDDLVDRRLQRNYRYNEMKRLITCAAACVRYSARHRPQMSQVVRALEGVVSIVDMNEHSRLYGSSGSSNYNVSLQRLRHMALLNQEYASSEYSAATSEYGQIPSASSEGQHSHEMEMGKMKNIQSFDSRR